MCSICQALSSVGVEITAGRTDLQTLRISLLPTYHLLRTRPFRFLALGLDN